MSRPETKVNRKTQSDHKQVEQELRAKVSSLEEEVRSLKRKLDELRKAKNTTLIKKEKEFVTTGFPRRETDDSESHKVKSENESLTKELKSLKLDRGELEARLKAIEAVGDSPCEHEEIINALQDRLAELESYNTALTMSHEELHAKLEQAYTTMSQKEAEFCETQEKTKVELQRKWQEMYKEWMRMTEAKIMELQAANDMLRRNLGQPP